jgi:YHS domain-containing protein
MIRNIFIFLGTFVAGALIALVTRAAMFNPHAGHDGHPAGGGEYSAMVSNTLAPNPASSTAESSNAASAKAQPAADSHTGHGAMAAAPAPGKPVNTVCAICGMDVDPKLPTAEYQGKTIGFGCRMCPPKFKADPDRYGPSYLRNEVIKK